MIVLDTNVLSALMGDLPDRSVSAWLDLQSASTIWTTALTIFEIRVGLFILPPSRRRTSLEHDLHRCVDGILEGRILAFDQAAAEQTAALEAARRRAGRLQELRDTMIAGIAVAHRATLATRNTRHFADLPVPVIDPWQR